MRQVILLILVLFSVSVLFSQVTPGDARKHYVKNNKKYEFRHRPRGSFRVSSNEDYMRRQKRIDERIKQMEYSIADLKREKSLLKKDYLKMLDEKIKDKDADIERLKKERSEVASEKARINKENREGRRETLDSRLSEKKREVQVLKAMKEKIDTSGND